MHSVLFVTSPPSEVPEGPSSWQSFTARLEKYIDVDRGHERLAENVWLLNLRQSTGPLGQLISAAEDAGIKYRLLPFERAPEWLPVGSGPNTIQGRSV